MVERRLLLNYRVDPGTVAPMLPAPLRPQVVNGWAVGGVCLLRLGRIRPRGVPERLGLRSENAAHRFAVEWDTPAGTRCGVYIPRRDTASTVNVLAGGRVFPGEHHRARFEVRESRAELRVGFTSVDRTGQVQVYGRLSDRLTGSGLFADLAEASAFFQRGADGYSATRGGDRLDGMRLRTDHWSVEPLEIIAARSSLFDDERLFPTGTALLDSALVMRDVPVTWQALSPMAVDPMRAAPATPR
ncbi:DUF2071 domain-containing protein [Plantactinospora siamensis]|uniref:DUF2071 domain-containing protein n=1 Tax=Plantactinospora siamensis TaxID=555372 RepID=A0ABV6P2I0_9ACTN